MNIILSFNLKKIVITTKNSLHIVMNIKVYMNILKVYMSHEHKSINSKN